MHPRRNARAARIRTTFSIVVALCLLLGDTRGRVLAAPTPAPTASSVPACSDGSRGGATFSGVDVFGHDIEDAKTLRFFARLQSFDLPHQRAVLKRMANIDPHEGKPSEAELGCTTELSYRTLRGLTLVEGAWGLDPSDPVFDAFVKRLEGALRNLGDDLALAPFGLVASDIAVSASTPSSMSACATPDREARTVRVHQPMFPPLARANRVTGTVRMRIVLNAEGFVRAITLLRTSAEDSIGARALVDESMLAAALSSYEPKIVACVPTAGVYVFIAGYTAP